MIPLPSTLWLRLAMAGAALAAAGYTGWAVNGWRLNAKLEANEAAHAKLESQRSLAAMNATDRARNEETRREDAKQEITQHALLQGTHVELAHAAVVAQRDGLLNAFAAAPSRGSACPDSAAGPASAPADDGLRSLLFGEAVSLAAEFAAEADQRAIAGTACVSEYESLRPVEPVEAR